MSNIKENIFENYFKLSQKIQMFEHRLQNEATTPDLRHALHKELESLQGSLEKLRQMAVETQATSKHFFNQLEEAENQVICLYRKIEEAFENYEITLISKEALELGKGFEKGSLPAIAKKVDDLKHNIQFLFKHRRPSLQNRKIVQLALQLANSVHEAAQNKTNKTEHFQAIALLRALLEKALLEANEMMSPEESELALELCEIAELYSQKKHQAGNSKLKEIRYLLSAQQQKEIDKALLDNQNMQDVLLSLAGASEIH